MSGGGAGSFGVVDSVTAGRGGEHGMQRRIGGFPPTVAVQIGREQGIGASGLQLQTGLGRWGRLTVHVSAPGCWGFAMERPTTTVDVKGRRQLEARWHGWRGLMGGEL